MINKRNKSLAQYLDVFVNELLKSVALIQGAGFLSGKSGIAILLYYYARYMQDVKISEYADTLTDIILDEISVDAGLDFDKGICGTVWAINKLVKSGFIQADEDVFEDIDSELFKETKRKFSLENFGEESWRGIYILNRLQSATQHTEPVWRQRTKEYLQLICQLLKLRYATHSVPVLTCKNLLPVIYICSELWNNDRYAIEINLLLNELPVVTKVALKEEKNYGDKYVLHQLLSKLPFFKDLFTVSIPESATLMDVNRFYLNRWIVASDISVPKIISDALINIVGDKKRMDEWLFLLNPDNAELGNYAGGLAWAMLQQCMEAAI